MFEALVVSDTHGNISVFKEILQKYPCIETVLHLGDVSSDVEALSSEFSLKEFYVVKGNNEYSDGPEEIVMKREGKTMLLVHGHRHAVKKGCSLLLAHARQKDAKIVLFGHTHIPHIGVEGGVLLVNPGSLCFSMINLPSYGILKMENRKIEMQIFDSKGSQIDAIHLE